MKLTLTLAAAGIAFAALACAANPVSAPLDRSFELRVGESSPVAGTDLEVHFEGVPSDSRCPPDVQCISAGDATVALRVTGGGKAATTYQLHTPRGQKEAEHGSYVVSLVALGPPESYVATLRVRVRD